MGTKARSLDLCGVEPLQPDKFPEIVVECDHRLGSSPGVGREETISDVDVKLAQILEGFVEPRGIACGNAGITEQLEQRVCRIRPGRFVERRENPYDLRGRNLRQFQDKFPCFRPLEQLHRLRGVLRMVSPEKPQDGPRVEEIGGLYFRLGAWRAPK